jgi:Ca2+-dependent lipid-binding protein
MESFRPGTAATSVASRVELAVECSNLIDADILSKSDPMCVLFMKELLSDHYYEVGRTETIDNNLNPKFAHRFVVDYLFEERQMLRFEVYVGRWH